MKDNLRILSLPMSVFLSVNPSTEPVGTKYGPCKPLVLEFDSENLSSPSKTHEPVWADGTNIITAGTNVENGQRTRDNFLARIPEGNNKPKFERLELKHPFGTFFTNTLRGGSAPSDVIDLFGIADDSPNLRYARIRIESGGD